VLTQCCTHHLTSLKQNIVSMYHVYGVAFPLTAHYNPIIYSDKPPFHALISYMSNSASMPKGTGPLLLRCSGWRQFCK